MNELGPVGLGLISFCLCLCFLNWGQFVCHGVSYFVFLCIIWFLFGLVTQLLVGGLMTRDTRRDLKVKRSKGYVTRSRNSLAAKRHKSVRRKCLIRMTFA